MGETTKWRERQFRAPFERAFVAEEMVSSEKMEGFTWIIAAAYREKTDDGTVVGLLGCITDISRVKKAEGFQQRKTIGPLSSRDCKRTSST